MAKAKTINMLLNDGTLNGVISMENSSWHKGELYSVPRSSVDDLISTDACARYNQLVYFIRKVTICLRYYIYLCGQKVAR